MNLDQQKKSTPNKLEILGYSLLDETSLEYIPQHLIAKKFCVDALIPSLDTIIQFDGDYWHGNPAKYTALDHRQERRAKLDKSQDAYMAKCGYTVIRFWESDIKRNIDHVRQVLSSLVQP
jgi:very-short-patch-repair endonuclease